MPTILIVEDNALVVQLVEQQLEDAFTIISAPNGKLGVESARLHKPDVILMDLTMPVMDGWTAIRLLRSDASTASIPIIALSATREGDDISRALASGADTYVPKPIDEAALRSALTRLLTASGSWRRPSLPGDPPKPGEPPKSTDGSGS